MRFPITKGQVLRNLGQQVMDRSHDRVIVQDFWLWAQHSHRCKVNGLEQVEGQKEAVYSHEVPEGQENVLKLEINHMRAKMVHSSALFMWSWRSFLTWSIMEPGLFRMCLVLSIVRSMISLR